MKTQHLYKHLFLLLIVLPIQAGAQWRMSRFDHTNFFQKALTIDADNAFVTGTEPVNQGHFMLRTNDGGITWDSLNIRFDEDTLEFAEMFFTDKQNGFVGGSKSGKQFLMKTANNGASWDDITPEFAQFREIHAIHFTDARNGFASNGQNLYKTTNGGQTWSFINIDFYINDIHFLDMNTGFASGTGGNFSSNGVIMKTTDGGNTWQEILDVRDPSLFVTSFHKMNVVDAQTIITAVQNTDYLFRTTNGGQTWDSVKVNLDSVYYLSDFNFTSVSSGHVLADGGKILFTNDGGATWKLEYTTGWGLYGPDVYLNSLSVKNGIGYVAGSNGLIKKYLAGTNSIGKIANRLQMNIYPNPVAGSSALQIDIPENSGNYTLSITNSSGQIITIEKLQADRSINLQKLEMAPGIYYVTLQNNNAKTVQKLVVTK